MPKKAFSIIMPAYKAQRTIGKSLHSVLSGSYQDFEIVIASDDGADYEAALAAQNISDGRLKFVSTQGIGTGSSSARNVALNAAQNRYIAILDADDLFLNDKLSGFDEALDHGGFVSCALDIRDSKAGHLRYMGDAFSGALPPARYKFVNQSMDSMIAYDRNVYDPRYDVEMNCLTDLDLILKLFAKFETCWHVAEPLHAYEKQPVSISIGAEASSRYTRMKKQLISRLQNAEFPMADPSGPQGFVRFLQASLRAEQAFEKTQESNPSLIFEDHLQDYLREIG